MSRQPEESDPCFSPESATFTERTRLAPSPTGALHLGNAQTFLINWALARTRGWEIILRIEDLDTPRVKQGVVKQTIQALRWLGIDWDGEPIIQSDRITEHQSAAAYLASTGNIYPCELTRSEIEAAASAPHDGQQELIFPPSLRPPSIEPSAFDNLESNWRLVVPDHPIEFDDAAYGPQQDDLAKTIGDFVVWTKRRQPSYQLACVVDDLDQGITQIVRGCDLLSSSARQIAIARALNRPYSAQLMHVPLVRGTDGRRLAKRHGDTRIDTYQAGGTRPERIIGLIASWLGIHETPIEMTAGEFAAALESTTIRTEDVIFLPEHDRYLKG